MRSSQVRVALFVFVCALSLGVVAAGSSTPPPAVKKPAPTATPRYAPGDEYFGRMKMSFLGINNTFKDQAIRAGAYTIDGSVIRAVGFADEALHDWEKRYPGDPQLARSYYLATVVYRKIWTKFYQDKAWEYLNIISQRYAKSFFGKQAKKDLAAGFTEHYFLDPLPCPTPTPTPVPMPSMPPSRHPTPTPTPTATPTPTPTPTETPTPAPGQPKQDVHVLPCVPAPSPTPTPTPMLTPLPSPSLPMPLHPASPLPSVSPPASIAPAPTPTLTATPR